MIAQIFGTIVEKQENKVVIMTQGGVGYALCVRAGIFGSTQIGTSVSLYTFLKMSDAGMDLYGFKTKEEKNFFSLLLSVSGVGPKSAMNILSLGSIDEIQFAIARGDVVYLTKVQGMGKKTAERMVLELKNKIQDQLGVVSSHPDGRVLAEAVDGLVGMGYSKDQVKRVIVDLDGSGKSVEELLRDALKLLSI